MNQALGRLKANLIRGEGEPFFLLCSWVWSQNVKKRCCSHSVHGPPILIDRVEGAQSTACTEYKNWRWRSRKGGKIGQL
jgi:hypothetical protein